MTTSNKNQNNPVIVRKSRIRTIAASQNEEFYKIVNNSFTTEDTTGIQANYTEKIENVNAVIGWQL